MAYEMRISDWSSDVCSSDLGRIVVVETAVLGLFHHLGEWSFGHAGTRRRREGVDSDAVPSKLGGLHQRQRRDAALRRHVVALPDRTLQAEIGRASCWARVCQSV